MRNLLLLFLPILFFSSCQKDPKSLLDETPYLLSIPNGFPTPSFPEDNELTVARVTLGKRLFYDPILSVDSTISCANCHKQELAFADDQAISPGVMGRKGFRNATTLTNIAYLSYVNKDGGVPKLDLQPIVPIEDHDEMAFTILEASDLLNTIPDYRDAFLKAYDKEASPFTITRSLGAFMRTFISGNSYYDQYKQGLNNLSADALAGMNLFFSEQTNCSSCHSGFNFTDNSFRNNGLYEDYSDWGRRRVTLLMEDDGKFRVPTLRNIALTAPYMHDGSLADLEMVVQHYNNGGSNHTAKDSLIRPLNLSETEQHQLIAFLNTLTDTSFIHNPEFNQ
ncbi:MAG: c-type cytochrome [Chitinophagales bacterium]|nr:c-type cytochrome [Chitinophagales bacterium]